MEPGPGEPVAGPWESVSSAELAARVLDGVEVPAERPLILAVDGRSGAGKSTLADLLADALPLSAVVHTDDVAWNQSMFEWTDLLITGVLEPLRRGEAVSYRPPAWEIHGRAGTIHVPAGRTAVIVEGVGAGRRELTDLIDALVWVQSDYAEAERAALARDIASGINGNATASLAFWHKWTAAETPFLAQDRPWTRATLITAGTSPHPQPPATTLVAPPLRA